MVVISELQASLIGAGVAAVAVIFAYNKWQERRQRRIAEKLVRPDNVEAPVSPFTGEERLEPSVMGEDPSGQPVPAAAGSGEPREDVIQPATEIVEPPLTLAGERTDIVVSLAASVAVPAPLLWPAQHDALPRLAKPVLWFGLNEKKGDWDILSAHSIGRYRRLKAALQLVDRQGPVEDREIEIFLAGMGRLAERFHAELHLPELAEVPALARDLDEFCAAVDVQITVNVLGTAGFGGTKIRGLAEASGFTLQGDGSFHYQDELGLTLFSLASLDGQLFTPDMLRTQSIPGLTLILDVPRVPDGVGIFNRMNLVAHQMAQALNARVVDDNKSPVDDRAVGIIRGRIGEFQQIMAERGIEAGSPLALRLFA